jgi:hypothetical protein
MNFIVELNDNKAYKKQNNAAEDVEKDTQLRTQQTVVDSNDIEEHVVSSTLLSSSRSKDPLIQWFIDLIQSEMYYYLDVSSMLILSWYITTCSSSIFHPKPAFVILFTLVLASSCLFFCYLSHKFYLRDNRIEILIHRIISLTLVHLFLLSFSVVAIAYCFYGDKGDHINGDNNSGDGYNDDNTFYCFPAFLVINFIKIVWHCLSFLMFFFLRFQQTTTAWALYLQMLYVGILNTAQPFIKYERLKDRIVWLMEEIRAKEKILMISLPSSSSSSSSSTSPSARMMMVSGQQDVPLLTNDFLDDEVGKFPSQEFIKANQSNYVVLLTRITQTEAYFMFDAFLILSSAWYTTYVGNVPKKLFILLLTLSLGSTITLFLYISHKFYLRMNRSEALIHRMVVLFFSHILQLGCIASVVLCSEGHNGNHIDDDNDTYYCSPNFIGVTYFKVGWHTISLILATTSKGEQTKIAVKAYTKTIFIGILNIFEIFISWNYLQQKIEHLHSFMAKTNNDLQKM